MIFTHRMHELADQLKHRAFPELAEALRGQSSAIQMEWQIVVREVMPQLDHLTFKELNDSLPAILSAMADALASDDPDETVELIVQSPKQGLTRFRQKYELAEIMQEDRLLRGVIVVRTEAALARQTDVGEAAALHTAIDLMLQQAAMELVRLQKQQLRIAAEAELKFLSYLSHDLNNELTIVLWKLNQLEQQLSGLPDGVFGEAAKTVLSAQRSIKTTIDGMRRLLEHERLRKGRQNPTAAPLDLHDWVTELASHFSTQANEKNVALEIDVPQHIIVKTYPELLTLVMQNLVGNAVKYSVKGVVQIAARPLPNEADGWILSVSDQGPGIEPKHLENIFEAFERGDALGHPGVGLGLSIASQAAKLLNTEIKVESKVGVGSTFAIALPNENRQAKMAKSM